MQSLGTLHSGTINSGTINSNTTDSALNKPNGFDAVAHNTNINTYYDSPAVQFFEQVMQQQIHLGYWDDKYPNISLAQAAQRLTQVVIDQLDLPKNSSLLDIGCGCGLPAIDIVKQKSYQVDGITINPQQHLKAEALAAESGLSEKAVFCVGDASTLPYSDLSFNCALLFESIHHIGHKEALAEAWRVLKPGGTILIADGVVLRENIKNTNKSLLAETFVARSLLTESEIYQSLLKAGFSAIERIDLTEAIQPSWAKLVEITTLNKAAIIENNGEEFFETMLDFWRQITFVWSKNAKYMIFKGYK